MKRARAKKVKSLDEQIQLKEAHLASSFNSMNEANKILNITKPPPLAAMLTKSYISTVQEVDEAKIPTPTSNFCGPVLVTKTYAKKFPDPPPSPSNPTLDPIIPTYIYKDLGLQKRLYVSPCPICVDSTPCNHEFIQKGDTRFFATSQILTHGPYPCSLSVVNTSGRLLTSHHPCIISTPTPLHPLPSKYDRKTSSSL